MSTNMAKISCLAVAAFLVTQTAALAGSHESWIVFYIDDPGAHLLENQCLQIKEAGAQQLKLKFKTNLSHPKKNDPVNPQECDDANETWQRKTYTLVQINLGSPPLDTGISAYAPKNLSNGAWVGDYLHNFQLYLKKNIEGEISDVWIAIPIEDPHPSEHLIGEGAVGDNGEHGGRAHGVR